MNNEIEILARKVTVFTFEECLDKLIEELSEAMAAALDLRYRRGMRLDDPDRRPLLTRLIEELADVDVSGIRTIERVEPYARYLFNNTAHHAIHVKVREAIRERQNQQLSLFEPEEDE